MNVAAVIETGFGPNVREQRVRSGAVGLAVREFGRRGRPVLLLVHGYPDSQRVWDAVIPALAADFHLITYDVRGAGASDRPAGLTAYRLERLAEDAEAVLAALVPGARVHLVGHDWGAIQGWEMVGQPDSARRFASFTSISGPCLDHVGEWLVSLRQSGLGAARAAVLDQLRRSWYIAAMQLPGLAPLVWKAGLGRLWPSLLARMERIAALPSPTQVADGCAGIQLYRANVLERLRRPQRRQVGIPVRLLVPVQDPHVAAGFVRALSAHAAARVPQLSLEELPGGHWLPLSQPEVLAARIARFVREVEG